MNRQTSLAFLVVQIASYLEIFCHVSRAADEEINGVSAHAVAEGKSILPHAIRKDSVVVPITNRPSFSPRKVCICNFDTEVQRVPLKDLRDVHAGKICSTAGKRKLAPFIFRAELPIEL